MYSSKLIRIINFILFFVIPYVGFAQKNAAEKVFKKVNHAVVKIYALHKDLTLHGQGSGVIIKDKGWLVTNFHLIGDADSLFAERDRKIIPLDSIVAIDKDRDILILRLSSKINSKEFKEIPDIKIGKREKLRIGQKVYAIGSPLNFENTITEGIVSGLRSREDNLQNFIQISAPLSKGSSGGALVNAKGELIGITTMIIDGAGLQNLNFAIYIDDVFNAAANNPIVASENDPRLAEHYFRIGRNEQMSRNFLSAIINYERALVQTAETEKKAIIYYYVGNCYHRLGMTDSAIVYYNRTLEITTLADAYTGLGNIYFERDKNEKALEYYKKALDITPTSHDARMKIALVYFSEGKLTQSLDMVEKSMRDGKYDHLSFFLVGAISYYHKDYERAEKALIRSIELRRAYAEPYYYLSKVYKKKGNLTKAAEYQQKAFKLKPALRHLRQHEGF
jgi:lipopolysaccharide biosynthesis regulator YciM